MGISLTKILAPFIEPVAAIVNKAVKDKDLAAKINHDIFTQLMSAETTHMKEAASIIRAEANSESWLTSNWRPLIMIWLGVLIGLYWFGFAPDYLVESPATVQDLFDLLKLGIGGYIMGRSGEKIVKTIAESGGLKKGVN